MKDPETIDALTSMGGISGLAAISRSILSEDRRSLTGFLRGLVCAVFVTFLVSTFIDDYHFDSGMHNMIVGVSAFVADDILILVIKLAKMATDNPMATLDWVINLLTGLRGKKQPPKD